MSIVAATKNLVALVVLVSVTLAGLPASAEDEDLPRLPGKPHLLMEADSGKILAAEAPFLRWAPASLTKMMTAYTVFRQIELNHVDMNSPVRVSRRALRQPPSKMGMPVGTILTVEAALNIIMVKSANDISVALAESVSGSEEAFVDLMNSHARRLGMIDTNFTNPHGLPDSMQFTSARDMAILAQTITKEFRKHDRFFNIPGIRVGKRRLRNHNALVERFPGTNGMKTGYVCASGFNVVVRTERKGRELIAVVFGGKSGLARNVKAAQLLQEGFDGKLTGTGQTLAAMKRPANASKIPADITQDTCPGKYRLRFAAVDIKPTKRPGRPLLPGDLDPIDTPNSAPAEVKKVTVAEIVPLKRPTVASTFGSAAKPKTVKKVVKIKEKAAKKKVPVDKPPSVRELARIYLTPRKRPREDVIVRLGGATGLNPNSIRLTNGGRYDPEAEKKIAEKAKDKPVVGEAETKPATGEAVAAEKKTAASDNAQAQANVDTLPTSADKPEQTATKAETLAENEEKPVKETAQNSETAPQKPEQVESAKTEETTKPEETKKPKDVAKKNETGDDADLPKLATASGRQDPSKLKADSAPVPVAAADGEMKPVDAGSNSQDPERADATNAPVPVAASEGEMAPVSKGSGEQTSRTAVAPLPTPASDAEMSPIEVGDRQQKTGVDKDGDVPVPTIKPKKSG